MAESSEGKSLATREDAMARRGKLQREERKRTGGGGGKGETLREGVERRVGGVGKGEELAGWNRERSWQGGRVDKVGQ